MISKNLSLDFILFVAVFQGDALVAQIGSFFSAGYETTSTTMSFFLYEMARNVILLKINSVQHI